MAQKSIISKALSLACILTFLVSPCLEAAPTLSKPKPNDIGNIPTLNEMGVMCVYDGWLYAQYVNAIQAEDQVLDIGCAYGKTVMEAAEKGAFVCANDLSEEHLTILKETVATKSFKDHITYHPGDFLAGEYPKNFYDKILIASVLHFMSPPEIQKTLQKMKETLKPGGKVYILTASPLPYFTLSEDFKKEYQRKKESGDEWPGYITNALTYFPHLKGMIPDKCTFSDLDILKKNVEQSGLRVIHATYESSSYRPALVNPTAQDFVNIIAEKPVD